MLHEDYSTLLADYMIGKFPLAQIKRQMYYNNAIYDHIPSLYFFLNEDSSTPAIYEKLSNHIENFQGNLKWVLYKCEPSKKNYAIAPIVMFEHINENKTVGRIVPKDKMQDIEGYNRICYEAILDIPNLVKYIKEYYG